MTKAEGILQALGGSKNLKSIEPCITRLRVVVNDPTQVDEPGLRESGAFGVVLQGPVIQVVVGPEADDLGEAISELTDH
ncbi:MAG: PTS transporter subunit EIIB [Ancrocorticia sp.]|uniref:PTS transporter subunit EIIB n=1 Tax=Ancrocorticia sp. TaxID=2593684 RepID=UPI003F90A900